MGSCTSTHRCLTTRELQKLTGKFYLSHGLDYGESYICQQYLQQYCHTLEVLSIGTVTHPDIQVYPLRLRVILKNGRVTHASYS